MDVDLSPDIMLINIETLWQNGFLVQFLNNQALMNNSVSNNSRLYIVFSVFFTARAYYPVLAILFIDLGLSLEQFVFLNLIWAAAIFLFEVPSGALADTLGRRRLLIAASILMVIEMLCLLLAPVNGGALLFTLCVINRICSGLSEACASGADEALAYDSLPKEGRAQAWDKLLATAMRWRSAGLVVAMIIGGLIYNPELVNKLLPSGLQVSVDLAHRIPVFLVFLQALVCLWATQKLCEPERQGDGLYQTGSQLKHAYQLTLKAAYWVVTHPRILAVILIGVAIDAIVRNFATISSSYFRLIELPAWTYGFLGAALGVFGWFVPGIAARLNTRFSLFTNLLFLAVAALIGLVALVPAWPLWGLIPAMFVMTLMWFLGFTISRVLHSETDSAKRATVLSVKGLIFNLGYGLFSLAFSCLLARFSRHTAEEAMRSALLWQVPFFAVMMLLLFVWASWHLRKINNDK